MDQIIKQSPPLGLGRVPLSNRCCPRPQKHGIAKEDRPFFPTWASTKQLVKAECQASGPKEEIHRVSDKVGGLLSSSCPSQLPRNECQRKYIKSSSKAFPTYLFFASSLVGLRRELRGVRAFGTDGEEALADAFSHEFKGVVQLTCGIHKRRNIEAKLKDLRASTETRGSILDIFGKQRGDTYFEGLVDAVDVASFDLKLQALRQRWHRLTPAIGHQSHVWFVKYEAALLKDTMIRPVREAAGLGSPPDQFSTNASEAFNKILKIKVDHKQSDLPAFVNKMNELISDQRNELEAVVVNCGKFKLKEQYRFLEVPEHQWYQKSPDQRSAQLKMFHKTTLISLTNSPSVGACSSGAGSLSLAANTCVASSDSLSVSVPDIASGSSVPNPVFEAIWSKASQLTRCDGAMARAPGYPPDAQSQKFVKVWVPFGNSWTWWEVYM